MIASALRLYFFCHVPLFILQDTNLTDSPVQNYLYTLTLSYQVCLLCGCVCVWGGVRGGFVWGVGCMQGCAGCVCMCVFFCNVLPSGRLPPPVNLIENAPEVHLICTIVQLGVPSFHKYQNEYQHPKYDVSDVIIIAELKMADFQ